MNEKYLHANNSRVDHLTLQKLNGAFRLRRREFLSGKGGRKTNSSQKSLCIRNKNLRQHK